MPYTQCRFNTRVLLMVSTQNLVFECERGAIAVRRKDHGASKPPLSNAFCPEPTSDVTTFSFTFCASRRSCPSPSCPIMFELCMSMCVSTAQGTCRNRRNRWQIQDWKVVSCQQNAAGRRGHWLYGMPSGSDPLMPFMVSDSHVLVRCLESILSRQRNASGRRRHRSHGQLLSLLPLLPLIVSDSIFERAVCFLFFLINRLLLDVQCTCFRVSPAVSILPCLQKVPSDSAVLCSAFHSPSELFFACKSTVCVGSIR